MRVNLDRFWLFLLAGIAMLVVGCTSDPAKPGGGGAKPCTLARHCPDGSGCVDGACVPGARSSLTVALAGTGSGTVTSTPAGIDCGPTCSTTFLTGTSVALLATPAVGSSVTGWSGGCIASPCNLSMAADTTVTVTFTADAPTGNRVTNVVAGSGQVSSGNFSFDVQIGGGLGPQKATSGTSTMEAGAEAHPGQQR